MTDKVVNLTYGGTYTYPGGTYFDISVTGTNLNQSDAAYMLEINTVFFSGTTSLHYASKDIVYMYRYSSNNYVAHSDNIWVYGDISVVGNVNPPDNIRITLSSGTAGTMPFRCFITAYVKDSVA
jgi:hypothetical protein